MIAIYAGDLNEISDRGAIEGLSAAELSGARRPDDSCWTCSVAASDALRRKNNLRQIVQSGPSNAKLDCGRTTPQDYPERTGFGGRREREWGHGGTAAGSIRSTHSCASISLAMTGSRCAARRLQQSITARLPLHRMRNCTLLRSAPSGCWRCGTLCPASKSERKLATATR